MRGEVVLNVIEYSCWVLEGFGEVNVAVWKKIGGVSFFVLSLVKTGSSTCLS